MLLPDALPLKPWSPPRPWRAASFHSLARCAARELNEELPLLWRRGPLLLACSAMQYLHGLAGQARTRPTARTACRAREPRALRAR
jgi:hypothetical protein